MYNVLFLVYEYLALIDYAWLQTWITYYNIMSFTFLIDLGIHIYFLILII